jgi:hypothetical protein
MNEDNSSLVEANNQRAVIDIEFENRNEEATNITDLVNLVEEVESTIDISAVTEIMHSSCASSDIDHIAPADDNQTNDCFLFTGLENQTKQAIAYLDPLYSIPFKYPHLKMSIGGRIVYLNCYHYHSSNESAPNNKHNKEYIDNSEEVEIYRWSLKGALVTKVQSGKSKKQEPIIIFAMCAMSSLVVSEKYICLSILTVNCSSNRTDFLVIKNNSSISNNNIEYWEGMDKIKSFICHPEIKINHAQLFKARFEYFDKNRWLYDHSRSIPIDTHYPGDMSNNREVSVSVLLTFLLYDTLISLYFI